MGRRLSARAFAPRLCGQPEKAEARAHRALPAPSSRSPDTDRGFGQCARRPPARRQDPPCRRVERLGEGACPSTRRRQHRLRPELLQSPRQIVRPANRYVRRRRHRLYSLVPAGSWQARQPKFAARPDRPDPRCDAEPDRAGLAAAAFPCHAANSGDLLDSASRGESRIFVDPLERRRVSYARFSLIGTAFAALPQPGRAGNAAGDACIFLPREARLTRYGRPNGRARPRRLDSARTCPAPARPSGGWHP